MNKIFRLLKNFLSLKQKKKIFTFFLLNIVNLISEISIVLFIIPLSQILLKVNPELPLYGDILFFANYNYEQQAIIAVLILIILFLFKTIFFTFFIYWQNNFAAEVEFDFSKRLFSKYLKIDYLYFLTKNTGDLSNKILFESASFSSLLKNFLMFVTEVLIFFSITAFIILYKPIESLGIIIFCLVSTISINFVQKKFSRSYGKESFIFRGKSTNVLIQTLRNIKDIKLFDKQNYFLEIFKKNFNITLTNRVKFDSLSETPKQLFELVLILSFGILIFLLIKNNDSEAIIISTSLFLTVFYRLLPSIVRITKSIQSINNNKYKFEEIFKDLDLEKNKQLKFDYLENKLNIDKFPNILNISNLSYTYPNKNQKTLDNLNLIISRGDKVGIMGSSGNGKTTLLNILTGLIDGYKGKILIDETELNEINLVKWRECVGYVSQFPTFINDTIRKNIALGEDDKSIDDQKINEISKICNLEEFINKLDDGFETIINEQGGNFSGGQLQRIAIARSLYKDPSFLILDESTSSMDKTNEQDVLSKIFNHKKIKTILTISHKRESFNFCNKKFKIISGSIVDLND
ncbi:ABC transporter ATP-binding protein/permease [Candidatus Pelagibacter sp.]|nr:ABC transporter ATP-binding protein/permease [Candidatus Pelagibacter sp.]